MAKKEKTDLQRFQEFVKWFEELVFGTPVKEATKTKPKRARTKNGRFKGDIVGTKDINEAWEGGKAPKKRKKNVKRKTNKRTTKRTR